MQQKSPIVYKIFFMNKPDNLADEFQKLFERLINRETIELNNPDRSLFFEVIAENLLKEVCRETGIYFDGAVSLASTIRKKNQVEFQGEMWIGENKTQWKETFRAIVTDKRITKQGIWIKIQLDSHTAEGNLQTAFGYSN